VIPFSPEAARTALPLHSNNALLANLPEAIVQFIVCLPAAAAYQGPIPDPDLLISLIKDASLPQDQAAAQVHALFI
jgi:hypothetical protein